MKKLKNNKGFSLVEILIGLSILVITLLAITNLLGSGIKTNKRAEVKQQGLILGQQILEEINAISSEDNVGKVTLKEMKLPSGKKLYEYKGENNDSKNTIDKLNFSCTQEVKQYDYNVEINMTKNSSFDNSDSTLVNLKTNGDSENYTISVNDNNATIKPGNIYITAVDDTLYMSNSREGKDIYIPKIKGNDIILNFTNEYLGKKGISLIFENNLDRELNINIQKDETCEEEIVTQDDKTSNLSIFNTTKINDFYEIEVNVFESKKDDTGNVTNGKHLFKGYANKNLKIYK